MNFLILPFQQELNAGNISKGLATELSKMSPESQQAVFFKKEIPGDMHPNMKLLRAARTLDESHVNEIARLSFETQAHIAELIMEKNPLPAPYNGKFCPVPESKPAPLKDRTASPDKNIVRYLLASYLYYEEDFSPISDEEYDSLCQELLLELDSVTHWARYLIDKDALKAGTGYHLHGKMPGALIAQAKLWRQEIEGNR